MADPCFEDNLIAKQQNRLRAALSKLSDVCNKNSKLTETVVAKTSPRVKSYGHQANYQSKLDGDNISALTRPPTPPQRTVSLSFFRVQDRDKTRSSSESQQIKAKYNNAPKSVVLIDSSGKTGCKMSNNSSDSEEDNLYSDVNNAFTLENELSKPDRSETASHVEALKEKVGMGMKCLIDVNSAVEVSLLITDENKIDTETGIGGTVGRSGDSHEESNDCEPAARVRKSLENISIPSWYTKYSENNIIKSKKWTRQKIEEGGWRRQNSVSSLSAISRSPSPSTRTSLGTSSRTSPSPSCTSAQNLRFSDRDSSWFQQPQIESKRNTKNNPRRLPPLPPGAQYTGWRSYNCRNREEADTPAYLQSPAQRLARSCSRL